jgi:hypothetical protein
MYKPEHRRALLTISVAMVSIALAGPASAAGSTFDGVYTGKRSLTNGPTSSRCPANDDVSVTIHEHTLKFTDSVLKDFVLSFDPQPDGSFDMTYDDVGGGTVSIKGRVTGASIDADVTNYSTTCTHHWYLTKRR